jgi:small subunit ribosomal protein S6
MKEIERRSDLATRVYEGLFLLDSNRYARDPAGIPGEIKKTVEQFGGVMLASRLWAEQRLAYPINGHRKGTYWLTYFRLDSDQQAGMIRQFRLNENILRCLVLRVDDRLVDALVAHASGKANRESSDRPVEAPAQAR